MLTEESAAFSWREKRAGKKIHDDLHESILMIGEDVFTYTDLLTKLQTRKVKAARILNETLKPFKPKSVAELADRMTANDLWTCDGVGEHTFYMWLNVLTYCNIDVDEWLKNEHDIAKMYRMHPKHKKQKKRRYTRHMY